MYQSYLSATSFAYFIGMIIGYALILSVLYGLPILITSRLFRVPRTIVGGVLSMAYGILGLLLILLSLLSGLSYLAQPATGIVVVNAIILVICIRKVRSPEVFKQAIRDRKTDKKDKKVAPRRTANHLIRDTTAKAIYVRGHWRKEDVSNSGIFQLKAKSNGFISGDTIERWIVFADSYPILKNTGNFIEDAQDYRIRSSAYRAELRSALRLTHDGYTNDDIALWEVKKGNGGAFVFPDGEYYAKCCRSYNIDPSYRVPFVKCMATSNDCKAFVIEELLEVRGTRIHSDGHYYTFIGNTDNYTEQTGRVRLTMEKQ